MPYLRSRAKRPELIRRTPRQRRSQDTVAAVLQAAVEVFEKEGYEAGTTDRIARRAGVSIGTLYQYFPNKDAILVALGRHHYDSVATLLVSLFQTCQSEHWTVERVVRAAVEAVVEHNHDRTTVQRLFSRRQPLPAALASSMEQAHRQVVLQVRTLLAALPGVRVSNLDCAAHLVTSTIDDAVHEFLSQPPPGIDHATFVSNLVRMVTAYLTAGCD